MQFDIITIFPKIFDSYLNESILKIAQDKKKIKINVHNLRDYSKNKHKNTDDTPYGGGAGMVMKPDIIFKALKDLKAIHYFPESEIEKIYPVIKKYETRPTNHKNVVVIILESMATEYYHFYNHFYNHFQNHLYNY